MRNAARRLLAARAKSFSGDELAAPAVVVSPHFDDEVLGCGGTILRKVAAGAHVGVMYLADGSRSHDGLIDAGELARRRQDEGRRACSVLGIADADVTIVGLPETELARNGGAVVDHIAAALHARRVAQVFVTCAWESDDHRAANECVWEAVERMTAARPQVLEFPVWAWARWPWIPLRLDEYGLPRSVPRAAIGGWRMLRDASRRVDVSEVLEVKRRALDEHRTQMTRQRDDVRWPILADIADGRWLENFFQPDEVFFASRVLQ